MHGQLVSGIQLQCLFVVLCSLCFLTTLKVKGGQLEGQQGREEVWDEKRETEVWENINRRGKRKEKEMWEREEYEDNTKLR